ncbi:YceI family protein [Arachnia propionica]|uniref:YceI family protein n=1 Tax=Arachnia propionica TaxID=1750 RepID=A0A3P1T915_9ACTN|nr:YceI family protein [Arachnia propionica]MDO5084630.1 YceI family protein [Arachnia propionica]RRD05675.1 YceI family protein [Arachnia propionica]
MTGIRDLGPTDGELLLGTTSEGPMARMGHALRILVQDWTATLELGEEPMSCSLRASANLTSLRALDGHGGASPLTEEGLRKIEKNAEKILDSRTHPEVSFVSTGVSGTWEAGLLDGELTIRDVTRPQRFDVSRTPQGTYRLTGMIAQSRFGIKPYSAMMGALRLGDDISVEVTVSL